MSAQYGDTSKKAEFMRSKSRANHIGFAAGVCCDLPGAVEKKQSVKNSDKMGQMVLT